MHFRSLARSGLKPVSICLQPCCFRAHVCPRRFDDARIRRSLHIYAEPNSSPRGFGAKAPNPSKKNKKKKKKSEGSIEPQLEFEDAMMDWDDCFSAACEAPEKVAEIVEVAKRGHSRHGRGVVYVNAKLKRQRRHGKLAAKALIHKEHIAGDPLETNGDLLVQSWSVVFLPGELLLPFGGMHASSDGTLIPRPDMLANQPASRPPEAFGVSQDVVTDLYRTFRGQDTARLLTLTGVMPDDFQGSDEAAYEPARDEMVLLLKTTVDGIPLCGADTAAIDLSDDGGLKLTGVWEGSEALS